MDIYFNNLKLNIMDDDDNNIENSDDIEIRSNGNSNEYCRNNDTSTNHKCLERSAYHNNHQQQDLVEQWRVCDEQLWLELEYVISDM
jgi:hypothetical protein